MPISAAALEEARDAIREAEKKKALEESQTLDLLPEPTKQIQDDLFDD